MAIFLKYLNTFRRSQRTNHKGARRKFNKLFREIHPTFEQKHGVQNCVRYEF